VAQVDLWDWERAGADGRAFHILGFGRSSGRGRSAGTQLLPAYTASRRSRAGPGLASLALALARGRRLTMKTY
jgi:hypothetical protein